MTQLVSYSELPSDNNKAACSCSILFLSLFMGGKP